MMSKRVEQGCEKILDNLKADWMELSKYRIPPQFFGPIAIQIMKDFQDEQFAQVDSECINYIVDFSDNEVEK